MAGRGRAPRPGGDNVRTIVAKPSEQPDLPEHYYVDRKNEDGDWVPVPQEWPQPTRDWWKMWAESPLSKDFTETDWSELRDTALVHARFWSGHMGLAQELRIRTAKFGATPEDRARLRIQFASAEIQEGAAQKAKEGTPKTGRKSHAGHLALAE